MNTPSDPTHLSTVSRHKLRRTATSDEGRRDSLSLRRFVLIQNSIVRSKPRSPSPPSRPYHDDEPAHNHHHHHHHRVEQEEKDVFVFPDLYVAEHGKSLESESGWLDAVLETLDDDDDVQVTVLPVDMDDIMSSVQYLYHEPADASQSYSHHPSHQHSIIPFPQLFSSSNFPLNPDDSYDSDPGELIHSFDDDDSDEEEGPPTPMSTSSLGSDTERDQSFFAPSRYCPCPCRPFSDSLFHLPLRPEF